MHHIIIAMNLRAPVSKNGLRAEIFLISHGVISNVKRYSECGECLRTITEKRKKCRRNAEEMQKESTKKKEIN